MPQRFFLKPLLLFFVFTLISSVGFGQTGKFTIFIDAPAEDTIYSCPGSKIIFAATAKNDDGMAFDYEQVTFVWNMDVGGVVETGSSISFAYEEGGEYIVTLSAFGPEDNPAQNTPEVHVFIAVPPNFTDTNSDYNSICSGNELTLTGFVTPVPWEGEYGSFVNEYLPQDFTWIGPEISSNRNGIAKSQPELDKGHQDYIFKVTDNFGCSFDTTITVYGLEAKFGFEPITGEAPLDVEFTPDSLENGGYEDEISFLYEFYEVQDTAFILSSSEQTFTFEKPGEYVSTMIAEYDQCSFRFRHEEIIKVDSSLLEIPNVFTPNGDDLNDYFQVKSRSLKDFHGRILNRWGKVIFEWTDWSTKEAGWDGTQNGRPVSTGTYYYIIEATGWDDIDYIGGVYKGFLTLLR